MSVNSPTQLLATVTVQDLVPPVPGASGVITGTAAIETAEISWTAATDNFTPTNQLRYYAYRSLSNNISTVADCEANGNVFDTPVGTTTGNAIGLAPNTQYWFNVVVVDMANNKAAYVAKSLTTEKATLSGTVSITGNAVFGNTLTADVSFLQSTPGVPLGVPTYQWKRNGVNIGDDYVKYTLVEADINQTITLTITTSNCNGSVTSAPTATVQKATQTAPSKPTAAQITPTSITLKVIAGCEYSILGGSGWQTSPIFTGLTPVTTYGFMARKPETNTHLASPSSQISNITTKDGVEEPQVLSVEITPKSANVQPSQTQQFTATVTAVGGANESVTWSVTGNSSSQTTVSSAGLLTVGSNESAKTITVKATSTFNTAKFDEATVTVGSVGIQTITNDELRITVYPNPTTGELNIQSSTFKVQSVEIYDIMGKKQKSRRAEEQNVVMDISEFPSGVYFVKINTENGTITKKVIKQ